MKVTLKFILSNWGLWPLLTAVFSLVLGVGITNNWGNAALWLWFCLIIVTLITQLYVMLQSLYLQPIITQYFIDNKSEIWLLFLIAHSKR